MAIEITRLFDFPYYQQETYNLKDAFTTKYNNKWVTISTEEYIAQANKISRGLLKLGVKPNDKIAIISSNNRTEWNVCDIGILQTGAQNVPIYPTICKEDYEYVLNHSESIYCFVSDVEVLEKINKIKDKTKLKAIYTFDAIAGEKSWEEVLKLGEDTSNQKDLDAVKASITSEDLATFNLHFWYNWQA
jgi:Long-chain acyl-CoA synthetases (AMP-forming)